MTLVPITPRAAPRTWNSKVRTKAGRIISLVLACGVILVSCTTDPDASDLSVLDGYASWVRVNESTITGDELGFLGGSVHEGATGFREIYVNPIGQRVSLGEDQTPFPVGSVLVKESFTGAGGVQGDLADITVMVKRETGYDSENGDWEYMNITPDMRIRAQGAIRACYACHSAAASTDFSFTIRE